MEVVGTDDAQRHRREINTRLDEIQILMRKESGVHYNTPEQQAKLDAHQAAVKAVYSALTEWRKKKTDVAKKFLKPRSEDDFFPVYETIYHDGLKEIKETNIKRDVLEKLSKTLGTRPTSLGSLSDWGVRNLVLDLIDKECEKSHPDVARLQEAVKKARQWEYETEVAYDDAYPRNMVYAALEKEQYNLWEERNALYDYITKIEKTNLTLRMNEIEQVFGLR